MHSPFFDDPGVLFVVDCAGHVHALNVRQVGKTSSNGGCLFGEQGGEHVRTGRFGVLGGSE